MQIQANEPGVQPARRPAQPSARTQPVQPVQPVQRRSKAEALHIVQRLKRGILVGAFVAFGSLSTVIAGHAATATANASQSTGASQSTQSSQSSQSSSSGSFFDQQGGSSFGSSATSQSPVSGSSVS